MKLLWLIALFVSAGCAEHRELRAVIQDASGKPIPGAVFYAEAYNNSGAFDFAFATADPSGNSAVAVEWKPGAKLALAAFAPGKKPMVVYDPLGRVNADGIVFPLRDLPSTGLRWEPRLANLSFPFEGDPKLAARVAAPQYQALRQAFWDAYALLGGVGLPRELAKFHALEKLPHRSP